MHFARMATRRQWHAQRSLDFKRKLDNWRQSSLLLCGLGYTPREPWCTPGGLLTVKQKKMTNDDGKEECVHRVRSDSVCGMVSSESGCLCMESMILLQLVCFLPVANRLDRGINTLATAHFAKKKRVQLRKDIDFAGYQPGGAVGLHRLRTVLINNKISSSFRLAY